MRLDQSPAGTHGAISRRSLLKAGVAAGGGLMLSVGLPALNGGAEAADADSFAPGAFIRIDRGGRVALIIPQVEMGKAPTPRMPMLVAEELGGRAGAGHGRARAARRQALWQSTARLPGDRRLDLGARVLGAAAPRRRDRPQHAGVGRGRNLEGGQGLLPRREGRGESTRQAVASSPMGALADKAAMLPVPDDVALKDASAFKLIGKPAKRIDTPDKVNGKAQYASTSRFPA